MDCSPDDSYSYVDGDVGVALMMFFHGSKPAVYQLDAETGDEALTAVSTTSNITLSGIADVQVVPYSKSDSDIFIYFLDSDYTKYVGFVWSFTTGAVSVHYNDGTSTYIHLSVAGMVTSSEFFYSISRYPYGTLNVAKVFIKDPNAMGTILPTTDLYEENTQYGKYFNLLSIPPQGSSPGPTTLTPGTASFSNWVQYLTTALSSEYTNGFVQTIHAPAGLANNISYAYF